MSEAQHVYEVRARKDRRGVDLISDVLPFGRLWYGEPNAVSNAIEYAKFYSRSRGAMIPVFHARRHSCEEFDRNRALYRVFPARNRACGPFEQSQRGGLVTEADIGEREISNQQVMFLLFFQERFKFVARLPPTFLGAGLIAADFLSPA